MNEIARQKLEQTPQESPNPAADPTVVTTVN
jgi:hypothetical protein